MKGRGQFTVPIADLSATCWINPHSTKFPADLPFIIADGADKSAVGTMNDSVGKLISQAQMGMTFTLKASMDLEFPNRVMNRPLRSLAYMSFIHPLHNKRHLWNGSLLRR